MMIFVTLIYSAIILEEVQFICIAHGSTSDDSIFSSLAVIRIWYNNNWKVEFTRSDKTELRYVQYTKEFY